MTGIDTTRMRAVLRESRPGEWGMEIDEDVFDTLPQLLDEVDQLRRQVETKQKVAGAYREALADSYRPHLEENATLKTVIGLVEAEADRLQRQVDAVRKLAERWTREARTPSEYAEIRRAHAARIREALGEA